MAPSKHKTVDFMIQDDRRPVPCLKWSCGEINVTIMNQYGDVLKLKLHLRSWLLAPASIEATLEQLSATLVQAMFPDLPKSLN